MITFKINSTKDLINRNAFKLAQALTPIKSEVYINKEDRRVNAKSVLGLLSIGISENDELVFDILEDEEAGAIEKIITKFFEEG